MFLWIRRYFARRFIIRKMVANGITREDAGRFADYILAKPRKEKVVGNLVSAFTQAQTDGVKVEDVSEFLGDTDALMRARIREEQEQLAIQEIDEAFPDDQQK